MKDYKDPLRNSIVYLSYPMECGEDFSWELDLTSKLKSFGINVFSPGKDEKQKWSDELYKARKNKDYNKVTCIAKKFVYKDLTMLNKSDFLIAYTPRNVPSFGVPHEIIYANSQKKCTLIMCPEGKEMVSAWLYGFINHKYMFGSWNDLYSYLQEVREGKHVDDKRWWYRYGLI